MNTHLLRRVRNHWNSDLVPPAVNRRNAKEWCKAVRRLGDRWVLRGGAVTWGHAQPIRKEQQQ